MKIFELVKKIGSIIDFGSQNKLKEAYKALTRGNCKITVTWHEDGKEFSEILDNLDGSILESYAETGGILLCAFGQTH